MEPQCARDDPGSVGFRFGEDVDLTGTVVGPTLRTDDFPHG
ncbi:hypothetical protein [Streptomyces sp. NPDC048188]